MKVNYQKKWGNDGTVFTQTIKIDKDMAEKFNKYVVEIKDEVVKKFIYSNEDMKILSYLEPLLDNINYTSLTTLNHFRNFYLKNYIHGAKRDKNFERILYRNTIIEVI
jgi:hypothetical protein